jgi:hypothetical protein
MEHTRIEPAGYRPLTSGAEQMLRAIYAACDKHKLTHTAFGRVAIGDPALVHDLLMGRELRRTTADRVRAKLAGLGVDVEEAIPLAGDTAATAIALPPDMTDALATHGLRELLFAPIPKVARALAGFDREQLGTAIEVMIAMLDAADPDPDAEPVTWSEEVLGREDDESLNDDDEDDDPAGQCDEDGINTTLHYNWATGAGCTISDPGDISTTEWHTRGRNKLHDGIAGSDGLPLFEDDELNGDERDVAWAEPTALFDYGQFIIEVGSPHEDAEEDDPCGQYDEDGVNTAHHLVHYTLGASGAGCPLSDPDLGEHDS